MTDPEYAENVDQGQSAAVRPYGETALGLLQIAGEGSEEGVEVRPGDVGLPLALLQRFDEASRGDTESLPQRVLDACGGDGHLCIALQLLKMLSVAVPGSPPGTFMMDWQTFLTFALALLRRTHGVPSGLTVPSPADGDWRKATLDMLEKASVTKASDSTPKSPADAADRSRGSLMLAQGYAETKQRLLEHAARHLRTLPRRETWSFLSDKTPVKSEAHGILGRWRTALRDLELETHNASLAGEALSCPHISIQKELERTDFAALTQRVKAEAARLDLDTTPIDQVFRIFCNLGRNPDLARNAHAWHFFCLIELRKYAELEPAVTASMDKLMGLLDAEALKPDRKLEAQPGTPPSTRDTGPRQELRARYERVWNQYTRAIQRGGFHGKVTDLEVYKWLLVHEQDISGMPKFETWQRYLRMARNFYGAQKNLPRHGRAHGGSVVLSKDIEEPDQDSGW